jgi:hypothetical protein
MEEILALCILIFRWGRQVMMVRSESHFWADGVFAIASMLADTCRGAAKVFPIFSEAAKGA